MAAHKTLAVAMLATLLATGCLDDFTAEMVYEGGGDYLRAPVGPNAGDRATIRFVIPASTGVYFDPELGEAATWGPLADFTDGDQWWESTVTALDGVEESGDGFYSEDGGTIVVDVVRKKALGGPDTATFYIDNCTDGTTCSTFGF